MTKLAVGKKVDVRHKDQMRNILRVQITAISLPNEFIGRVEEILLTLGMAAAAARFAQVLTYSS